MGRREDREKLESFVQRNIRIRRLGKHASIELDPGKLAIDVKRGIVEARGQHTDRHLDR